MFADALRSVPLFGDLDPDLRTEVAERATPSRVEAGEWLFRRGEPAESLYVVLSGRLEVLIESPEPVAIRLADQGAALGELALLTDSTRSASVRARRDSELLGLHRDDFLKLLEGEPAFALALARALAALLRKSRSLAPEPVPLPATIALLPAGPGLAVGRMAELLTTQLGAGTTVLTPPVPQPGPVLDRAERENERVLLVGGEPGAGDEWNRFCIRQADRVLVLAEGRPPADVERLRTLGQREVLLAGAAEPGALAQWLDALDAASGRLVGPPGLWPKTVRRTSRALMGRSVGLVLSGGGARAFAHIGVVEELLASGVELDRVAGSSMGAFVGAQVAMGLEPGEIYANCEEEFIGRKPLSDYTVPVVSLVRGLRAKEMVERRFGDRLIEELPREFFCVSCDLVTSELVLHRRGPLFEAVGASCSLPGVGPPVALGQRLLVDGGVLNNLPIEPLADSRAGPVIASDVTAQFQVARRDAASTAGTRARVRGAVLGLGAGIPLRLHEVVMRTITLGSLDTVAVGQQHADLVITPDVHTVSMVAFDQLAHLREAGRRSARAALESDSDVLPQLTGT
jgi:NTE family protein